MHYQRFRDHDYLGAWDFEEGARTVTIRHVVQGHIERDEFMLNADGSKVRVPAERVPLMHFVELDRPLVLNATNGALITAMYGSPDTRDWEGKRVTLTRGMTTTPDGQPTWGVRVHPMRPAAEEPTETPEQRLARLEAELAKVRADAQTSPTSPALPPKPPVSNTVPAADVIEEVSRVAE